MGRKNRKYQEDNNSFDNNLGDDLSSNYTIATETETTQEESETNTDNETAVIDAITEISDLSLERKQRSSSHREKVYRQLFKALSQHGLDSQIGLERIEEEWGSVIVPNCLIGVSRAGASPSEQYSALRCLEVLPILLGSSDGEGYLDDVYDPLMELISNCNVCSKVRSVALRVITMSAFLCGTTGTTLDTLLDLCHSLSHNEWRNNAVPNPLRCSAFDCWSILSTLLQDADVVEDEIGKGIPMLVSIRDGLKSSDLELRESAGKCFILIHEHRLNLTEHSENPWGRGSWHDSESFAEIEELTSIIQELSLESSHYISRKAKKTQKKLFREMHTTLESGTSPSDTISTASTTLTLNSWSIILIFNFIKQCLQAGLHHHLQHNSLLHSLLQLDYTDNTASLSAIEKRLILSKTSDKEKAKDRNMIKRRECRNNAKNSFIMDDM